MVVCPKCRSDRTAPILYGYPSHEAFEAEERGELILGGCEMIDGMPHEDYIRMEDVKNISIKGRAGNISLKLMKRSPKRRHTDLHAPYRKS